VWNKNKGTGHLNAKKMPMRFHETLEVFYKKPPTYNPQMTTGHKKANSATNGESSNYGDHGSVKYEGTTERHPRNVIDIPVINNDGTSSDGIKIHPTQKPIALMEYMIKTYSNEGDTVLDFTIGSGSTIKAAKNLNRKAIGIENGCCEKKGHKYEGVHWVDVLKEELRTDTTIHIKS
jgi:site-specific DNA-methyltransferase (adenine-specific)